MWYSVRTMDAKLTLKLNKEVIDFAKKKAKKKNTSLSKMVEEHFRSLTLKDGSMDFDLPKNVEKLSGVISEEKLDNRKKEYIDYLTKKYT